MGNLNLPRVLTISGIILLSFTVMLSLSKSLSGSFVADWNLGVSDFGLSLMFVLIAALITISGLYLEDTIKRSPRRSLILDSGEEVTIYELPHCFLVYREKIYSMGHAINKDDEFSRRYFEELHLEPTKDIIFLKSEKGIRDGISGYQQDIRDLEAEREKILKGDIKLNRAVLHKYLRPEDNPWERKLEYVDGKLKMLHGTVEEHEKHIYSDLHGLYVKLHEMGHLEGFHKWGLQTYRALHEHGSKEWDISRKWSETMALLYEWRGLVRYSYKGRIPIEELREFISERMSELVKTDSLDPYSPYRKAVFELFDVKEEPDLGIKDVLERSKLADQLYHVSNENLGGLMVQLNQREKELDRKFREEKELMA